MQTRSVHDGSWCELIAVPENNFVAHAPANTQSSTAGAAPLSGISAIAERATLS